MSCPENYTVIGAGHGGKAMAAHLSIMGKRVTLFNRTHANIQMMAARGGIELESYEHGPRGFGNWLKSPPTYPKRWQMHR